MGQQTARSPKQERVVLFPRRTSHIFGWRALAMSIPVFAWNCTIGMRSVRTTFWEGSSSTCENWWSFRGVLSEKLGRPAASWITRFAEYGSSQPCFFHDVKSYVLKRTVAVAHQCRSLPFCVDPSSPLPVTCSSSSKRNTHCGRVTTWSGKAAEWVCAFTSTWSKEREERGGNRPRLHVASRRLT